jgi:hypothetical protein
MKLRVKFRLTFAMLFATAAASAQIEVNTPSNPYQYTYRNGNTLKINWKPETAKSIRRYTVAVNPTPLFNNGLRFDFEYELPHPGQWLQVGLTGYYSSPRNTPRYFGWNDDDEYDRHLPVSSWVGFRKMSGGSVSILYKKMLHRRGWYFSTGLAFNYFRVEYTEWGYKSFEEDGLTFYRRGEYPVRQSFFRPTAEFNIGKQFAITNRCFFDLYAGTRVGYSFYKKRNDGHRQKFHTMYGFANRGIDIFHGGVRFGVLLWDRE